jgi:S-adenosylmethionine:tRNA ribosyltransferase-isomerase
MTPARAPRDDARTTRLLRLDVERDQLDAFAIGDLPDLLAPGDLLVCNDAATLPASLPGTTERGEILEARLAAHAEGGRFLALLFGDGDWRQRTEERWAPPAIGAGERLHFRGLEATVTAVDANTRRLVTLAFDFHGAQLWRALYAAGRPVQYSYLARPLALWDVQTPFASRPWAFEPPSAGLPLTWDLLLRLRARGVRFARVTHAAGLSSTGDAELDRRLPLPERCEVPAATVLAVTEAQRDGARVLAVGTTVVRALESAAAAGGGRLLAGAREATLRLDDRSERRIVDGILTGMHEPDTSHFALLQAFAPRSQLLRLTARAEELGLLAHEFGDTALIMAPPRARALAERRAS